MKDYKLQNQERFNHISKACSRIQKYTGGLSREQFLADKKVQDAVLYQLIIIGEAVVNIDIDILEKYPYPWFKIRSFRNYAAHEYFNIQAWTVWDIVNQHINDLEDIVKLVLKNEF